MEVRARQRPSIVTLVFVGVYLVLLVAVWVWTTDALYLTDGTPTARDPFSPAALALINVVLVLAAWRAAGALYLVTLAAVWTVRAVGAGVRWRR